MTLRVLAIGLCLALIASSYARAVVIDDFSVGGLTLSGPGDLVAQTGLDPQHVIGGSRHIRITSGPTELSIDPTTQLTVTQGNSEWGYFYLLYGYDAPLNSDFTAGGHDRMRFRFNDVGTNWTRGAFWVSVNTSLPPGGSAPGVDLEALYGGGIFEIPFSSYNKNFSDVDTVAIQVARMENDRSFSIAEVITAGPPVPGDFDRNGFVDFGDLAEWQRTYGRTTNTYYGFLSSDENRDGKVDGRDFLAWQRAYQTNSSTVAIPEPSAFLLIVPALATLFRVRFV